MISISFRTFVAFVLLCSLGLILPPQLCAGTRDGDKTIRRLNKLINRSGKDYRVKIRITSQDKEGNHSAVYLSATRDADPQGDWLLFHLEGDTSVTQEFCLKCQPDGGVTSCDQGSLVPMKMLGSTLAGSILPWEEILVGSCGSWLVEMDPVDPDSDDGRKPSYVVQITNAAFDPGWVTTKIIMDSSSKDPLYFDRIDSQGILMRRIKVLEIGGTGSWRGIQRAIIEMNGGRVLMEIVDFQKGSGQFKPSRENQR